MNEQKEAKARLKGWRASARKLTLPEMQERLHVLVGSLRDNLEEAGALVVEIERAGAKVECDTGLLDLLRMIGRGDLLVGIVMRHGYRGHTFDAAKRLPVEEQEKLLQMPVSAAEESLRKAPRTEQKPPKDDIIEAVAVDEKQGKVVVKLSGCPFYLSREEAGRLWEMLAAVLKARAA